MWAKLPTQCLQTSSVPGIYASSPTRYQSHCCNEFAVDCGLLPHKLSLALWQSAVSIRREVKSWQIDLLALDVS